MRLLADECVDAGLVSVLQNAGHDVSYVAETAAGLTDAEVLRLARDESRLFLTEDKDFGELIFRFRLAVPGLVLLRIDPTRVALKGKRLEALISQLGERLFGRYVVVTETRARSRALPPTTAP
jgi:predicted nuclease of predicted toxin-antitoxin system